MWKVAKHVAAVAIAAAFQGRLRFKGETNRSV
jgi:hypothetical protein